MYVLLATALNGSKIYIRRHVLRFFVPAPCTCSFNWILPLKERESTRKNIPIPKDLQQNGIMTKTWMRHGGAIAEGREKEPPKVVARRDYQSQTQCMP